MGGLDREVDGRRGFGRMYGYILLVYAPKVEDKPTDEAAGDSVRQFQLGTGVRLYIRLYLRFGDIDELGSVVGTSHRIQRHRNNVQ